MQVCRALQGSGRVAIDRANISLAIPVAIHEAIHGRKEKVRSGRKGTGDESWVARRYLFAFFPCRPNRGREFVTLPRTYVHASSIRAPNGVIFVQFQITKNKTILRSPSTQSLPRKIPVEQITLAAMGISRKQQLPNT